MNSFDVVINNIHQTVVNCQNNSTDVLLPKIPEIYTHGYMLKVHYY